MKLTKLLIFLVIISIIYLSISVNGAFVIKNTNGLIDAYKNNNLIRLHVVANSNSPTDQYIKRRVRDQIIEFMNKINSDSIKREKEINPGQTTFMENKINAFLQKIGVEYKASINFNNYYFPKRTYGRLSLPAGRYRALKIDLGQAQGANWWCVLLPPLCIEKDEKNIKLNKENVEVKYKIVELLKSADLEQLNIAKNFLITGFQKLNINILKPETDN